MIPLFSSWDIYVLGMNDSPGLGPILFIVKFDHTHLGVSECIFLGDPFFFSKSTLSSFFFLCPQTVVMWMGAFNVMIMLKVGQSWFNRS